MSEENKVEITKYPDVTIQTVKNGFIVHCSSFFSEREGMMHRNNDQYVFNTADALGQWVSQHIGTEGLVQP